MGKKVAAQSGLATLPGDVGHQRATEAQSEARTRVYVLRSTNGSDMPSRYIEATSKTAAMLYVASALYTIDAASGKDLRDAWKAGAQMESAT
ncbi:MAG TPA: hypothetical protein VHQ92_01095 [Pseudolabrys sp.]|jgi:hypothetical protein|nr:hypothetical protein [Pseudolabrys sp.]